MYRPAKEKAGQNQTQQRLPEQRRFMDQEAAERKEVMDFPRGTNTKVLWADKEEGEEKEGEEEEEKQNPSPLPWI